MKEYDVLILGGGVSGISAAYHLKNKCKTKPNFLILESEPSFGGTWARICYPGIRSDSDMFTYAFDWYPWLKEKKYAKGGEILNYLEEAIAFAGIKSDFEYNTKVVDASFNTNEHKWTLKAENGKEYKAKYLFNATGYYSYESGYTPPFEGLDKFEGKVVHCHNWKPKLEDYKEKKVVVIGSGATAASVCPAISDDSKSVTMLQRSPGYYFADSSVPFVFVFLKKILGLKLAYTVARFFNFMFTFLAAVLAPFIPGLLRSLFKLDHKRQNLPKDFDIEKHFTPKYNVWEERVCMIEDSDFFKKIKERKLNVVTDEVERFDEKGIILKSGERLDAELVALATGFHLTTNFPFPSNLNVKIDDVPYNVTQHYLYSSAIMSGIPNLVFTMGYAKFSWTFKADLVSIFFCRLLSEMDRTGLENFQVQTPKDLPSLPMESFFGIKSNYLKRAQATFPKFSSGLWNITQFPNVDLWRLKYAPFQSELIFY